MPDTDKVFLQHPHHPDDLPVEVDNTTDAIVPYMVKGYVQVHPDTDQPMSPDTQPILSSVPEPTPLALPELEPEPSEPLERESPPFHPATPKFYSPGRE